MMKKYKTSRVFVPGGMPLLTYVARTNRKLEEKLESAKDYSCKLVTITGSTKSGKTVLVNKIFPRDVSIWVDGGTIKDEEDLWHSILESIDGYSTISCNEKKESSNSVSGSLDITVGLPLFMQGKGELGGNYTSNRGKENIKSRNLTARTAAISQLKKVDIPLIIDDFHYLDRSFQGSIIRALKPLIFEGLPVILIAIPHRRYDVIKVEREMTGRLDSVMIPPWEVEELELISKEGFPLLNMDVKENVNRLLAKEAYGSPHLMQEFCKKIAIKHGIKETVDKTVVINKIDDQLFKDVASGTGKVIFDKLAKGPKQRSDRIQRTLKNGEKADIYRVILLALAKIKAGLETIEYEQLRSAIKDVLIDNIPQAHEVTRVLEKMNQIATKDESSTPVLDWEREEQMLHITDPFFAFYLKWGVF